MKTGEGREISQLKVIDKQRRKQRGGNIPAREMKQMGHKEVGDPNKSAGRARAPILVFF